MTVNTTARYYTYVGNGSTDTFAVPFQFYQLDVYVNGTLKTQGTHYTLKDEEGLTLADGGGNVATVEFDPDHIPAASQIVALVGSTALEQSANYQDFDDAPEDLLEGSLDKLTMMVQEINEKIERSFRSAKYNPTVDALDFEDTTESIIYINADGEPELRPITDFEGSLQAAIDAAEAAADAEAALASINTAIATALTFATTKRVFGRNTAGSGAYEEVTAAQILNWLGTAAQGDLVYYNGATWVYLPRPSVASLLTHAGTASDPAWATAASAVGEVSALPPGYYSTKISNNVSDANNDIDIAAGKARDTNDSTNMVLAGGITKQLDAAWALGTNAGGLDTGAKANSTLYYVWLIKQSVAGTVDVLFSTSATVPTMPSGLWDRKQRVGWFFTDGSGNIRAFKQNASDLDYIAYSTAVEDLDVSTVTTARTLVTMTAPPLSIVTFRCNATHGSAAPLLVIQPTHETDAAPTATAAPGVSMGLSSNPTTVTGGQFSMEIDASRQIGVRSTSSSTSVRMHTTAVRWKPTF